MQIKYGNKKVEKKKSRKKKPNDVTNNPKITGIIICVDFSDFLKETLPFSKPLLNDLYIVTSEDDNETKKLCKRTNTKYLSIPRTKPFLKGVYINHALFNIKHKDWFLLSDADIVLPSKKIFDISEIEGHKQCLYGVFCTYCNNYEEWADYRDNNTQYYWRTKARTTHIGMGAFQLFHTNHFQRRNFGYPPYTGTMRGGRRGRRYTYKGSDYVFSRLFNNQIKKLPFNVIHLNSQKHGTAKNNNERKTMYFGKISD